MHSNWWNLKFNEPLLESRYQRERARRFHDLFRILLLFALPLILVGPIADHLLFPEQWNRLNVLRLGSALPLVLLALGALRFRRIRRNVDVFIPFWLILLCLAYFLPTMLVPLPRELQDYVLLFWVFPLLTLVVMTIGWGLVVGLLIVACFEFSLSYHQIDIKVVVLENLVLLPVGVSFLVIRVLLEIQSRSSFKKDALLREEKKRSEALLLNIFPPVIIDQLKSHPALIADSHSDVTVLFSDIVGFTPMSERIGARELVSRLNELFGAFDKLTLDFRLEKIKTIGDAYMVAGGLPGTNEDHLNKMADLALEMKRLTEKFSEKLGEQLTLRIGLHVGSVVAGVIGKHKYVYDLWGDTVNTASRMESNSIPGSILVTEEAYERLKPNYHFDLRDPIEIRGKGLMRTFFLRGPRSEFSTV